MTTLLPNAKQQFVDALGVPLGLGQVFFYVPGTTTFKNTWQDNQQVTLNANPVQLDSAGRAIVFGSGDYRQIVQDKNANTIWDQISSSPGTDLAPILAASSGATLIGTIQSGAGAVVRTVAAALSDMVTAKQYGVVGNAVTNDATAFGNAVTAAIPAGALALTSPTSVGSTRPSLSGVQMLGNKAVFYDLGTGLGKMVANRRGRDLGQKVLGRAYLARLWNFLSLFGVNYTASVYMTGDSVTAGYVGPILQGYLTQLVGIGSVVNNAISGTTIEQWRTGTGAFAASGKALSDWIAAPTDVLYIAFGINTPYFGGTPAQFATSLDSALASIRAVRDISQTSIVVVLPLASRDGGAMTIEGGWKRDEYFVYSLRELCEPLVDKYKICLYDPTVDVPESNPELPAGANGLIWLDTNGVHPVYGHKYFLAGQIFDTIVPNALRSNIVTYDGTAPVVPATGFTLPALEPMRTVRSKTSVISDGYVAMTTPAALTAGQAIATVAVNFSPFVYSRYVVLQLYNGAWETIRGEIDNTTRIVKTGSTSVMSPTRVYFYGAWNAS